MWLGKKICENTSVEAGIQEETISRRENLVALPCTLQFRDMADFWYW